MATQRNHYFPVDHKYFSHLLTSINWWSSQREKTTPDRTYNKQKGKLEQKRIYHTIIYTSTVKYTYIIQPCYDLPNNTLRLEIRLIRTYI